MKIAFVGFSSIGKEDKKQKTFTLHKMVLFTVLVLAGHQIVTDPKKADVLLIPHHKEEYFPENKPWIAIWLVGCNARLMDLSQLQCPPLEIVYCQSIPEFLGHIEFLLDPIEKLKH
jgi:hypothetical protein